MEELKKHIAWLENDIAKFKKAKEECDPGDFDWSQKSQSINILKSVLDHAKSLLKE